MSARSFANPADIADVRRLMDLQKAEFHTKMRDAEDAGVDLVAERSARYLVRWKEALVHVRQGASVLDIGGGWMPPSVVAQVHDMKLNYHAYDVDPLSVFDTARKMAPAGLPPQNFQCGETSTLPFSSGFDMVFSSHCLEHAIDIIQTLSEIRRVLNDDGYLFMSVPLGFDLSDEHVLFFGDAEWKRVLQAMGYEVVNSTIGTVYVECGDLTILARKKPDAIVDEATARRITGRFRKAGHAFLNHLHSAFRYPEQNVTFDENELILHGIGTRCEVELSSAPGALIIMRHPWSGYVRVFDDKYSVAFDAYHGVQHMVGLDLSGFKNRFTIEVVGKNILADRYQCVIVGLLLAEEAGAAGVTVSTLRK